MSKIFLPDISKPCYVVQSEGVIRQYAQMPVQNSTINYRDYFINDNYLYKDGSQTFSTYSVLPVCLDSSLLTTEVYYRQDFDKILVMFIILAFIVVYCPLKIFYRFWKRGRL